MSEAMDAAEAKAGIWRSHDERNVEKCRNSASEFYRSITDADQDDLDYAGEMTRRAFWLADEAEKYQNTDKKKEDFFYECAENCLEEAFESVGMPKAIAKHRRVWWRAYRHGEDLKPGLEKDLRAQANSEYREEDAVRFMEAASAHDGDDWEQCIEILTPFYEKVI